MLFDVVVPIVHVVACVFLIVVVLLQTGKGADMGAVFGGGGSQTLFGATGAGNLLTKLTTGMAVTFMLTSLTLGVAHRERPGSDLLQRLPDTAAPIPPPPAAPDEATAEPVAPAGDAPAAGEPNAAAEPAGLPADATAPDVERPAPTDAVPDEPSAAVDAPSASP